MLVTRQIPALYNGVSQQPAPVRLSSQAEDAHNCMFSVVDGARKRSPMEHVAKLTNDRLGSAYLHAINRDVNERYEVIVTAAGIRVFDMAGVEKTVTAPLGWGYLALPAGAEARFSFVCMTVADYTFVLNKTKVVGMLAVGADQSPPSDSYWWLNRPLSGAAAPAREPLSTYIEGDYFEAAGSNRLVSAPTATTLVANPAPTLKGTKQTLQDLPATGNVVGDVWKIIGTDQSAYQSYYVIYTSAGTWDETVKPGLKNLVNANTMPHALVRQGDGTFIFGPFAWSSRRVGDEATNPNPTFVGRAIRDMFFYRNRFGLCVDENVVMSRAGDFGNFYRLTVVDLLPDEVVDIAASETKVTKMEFAVPFQGALTLWSDQVQFKLNHNEIFSGSTVSLDVTTQYPMATGVRPAASGADVYFASQGSGYGLVREYYVDQDGNSHDASDVTAHVPQFLPRPIVQLASAPEYDMVFVLSPSRANRIYVYKYYWQSETEKAQSAWNAWIFEDDITILAIAPLGGYLMCLVDRPDGTYLERVPMFYGGLAAGLSFQVYLDRRCEITGVYNAGTGRTDFTLPYPLDASRRPQFRLVLGNAFPDAPGAAYDGSDLTWASTTVFSIAGDLTAGPCVVGLKYTMRYVFSRQYPQNSRGEAIHTGRLQLKTFSIYHTDTAYFRAEVRPFGPGSSQVYTKEFPMYRVSVEGYGQVGPPLFVDGKVTFAVQANAGEAEVALVNDSHLGCCFHAAEWEGFYHNRARA